MSGVKGKRYVLRNSLGMSTSYFNHLIPLGLYLLKLFSDIHHLYSNQYLHRVDSNTTIICESYNQAIKTADALKAVETPKLAKLLELLTANEYDNVTATFDLGDSFH